MLVVPIDERTKLRPKVFLVHRHHPPPCPLVFQRADEAFGNGDAALLSHGTMSQLNTVFGAPLAEFFGDELATAVGNQYSRRYLSLTNCAAEKPLHLYRSRLLGEHRQAHRPP